MSFVPFDPTRARTKPLNNLKPRASEQPNNLKQNNPNNLKQNNPNQPNVKYDADTRTKIIKRKLPKTQRRKLNNRKKTKRVSFNLSGNSIRKYYCPELQPSWINKIEQAEPIAEFKVKKVPSMTLKELFKD